MFVCVIRLAESGYYRRYLESPETPLRRRLSRIYVCFTSSFEAYIFSALFFTLSVECVIAYFVILYDYGLGPGLAAHEVEISWCVGLLCIVPLVQVIILPATSKAVRRKGLVLLCACVCWVLEFYLFLSRMVGMYGSSEKAEVLTPESWQLLDATCYGNSKEMVIERKIMDGLFVAGSVFIAFVFFYKFAIDVRRNFKLEVLENFRLPKTLAAKLELFIDSIWMTSVLAFIAMGQIWSVLRIQQQQKALASTVGEKFTDNEWGFGQFLAVFVWLPVLVEFVYYLMCKLLPKHIYLRRRKLSLLNYIDR